MECHPTKKQLQQWPHGGGDTSSRLAQRPQFFKLPGVVLNARRTTLDTGSQVFVIHNIDNTDNKIINNNTVHTVSQSRAFINLELSQQSDNGPKIYTLFDTGAAVSLLSPEQFKTAKQNNCVKRQIKNPLLGNVCNASGTPMHIAGVYDIEFYIDNRKCMGSFIVSRDIDPYAII